MHGVVIMSERWLNIYSIYQFGLIYLYSTYASFQYLEDEHTEIWTITLQPNSENFTSKLSILKSRSLLKIH